MKILLAIFAAGVVSLFAYGMHHDGYDNHHHQGYNDMQTTDGYIHHHHDGYNDAGYNCNGHHGGHHVNHC